MERKQPTTTGARRGSLRRFPADGSRAGRLRKAAEGNITWDYADLRTENGTIYSAGVYLDGMTQMIWPPFRPRRAGSRSDLTRTPRSSHRVAADMARIVNDVAPTDNLQQVRTSSLLNDIPSSRWHRLNVHLSRGAQRWRAEPPTSKPPIDHRVAIEDPGPSGFEFRVSRTREGAPQDSPPGAEQGRPVSGRLVQVRARARPPSPRPARRPVRPADASTGDRRDCR
jgi:hypothetical protein